MSLGSEILQNSPKYIILGVMEAIGCVRVKTFVGSSVPRNSALGYRNAPVSHRFECMGVVKSFKMLPNIILGLMGVFMRNICRKFGTPKQCLRVPKRTSSSMFWMH